MVSMDIVSRGMENVMAVLPAIIGALVVLIIGWVAGRLLGKAARIIIDKITATATATPTPGDKGSGGGCSTAAGFAPLALILFVPLFLNRRKKTR